MTTKIAAIPPLDGVKDPAIKRVLQSIKDMLEIRDGQRKSQDGLDRYVTLREFSDAAQASGLRSARPGGGFSIGGLLGQINNGLYDKPDLSRPPTLTGLEGAATMTTVALRWDSWTSDLRHGMTEVWRADVDDIGLAVPIGTAPGDLYFDAVGEPGKTYYYWIRAISRWEGAPPGFFNAARGTAVTTTIDPAQLMPYLVDSINESHLVGALRTRLDLIDGLDPNSIASRLLAESEARAAAIAQEALTRSAALQDEVNARNQAISAEAAARVVAINAERDARVQALAQEALDRGAAISTEAVARQSADESLAAQITTLTAVVDDNVAAIQTESTARADADAALAEHIAVVAATSDAIRSATAAMIVQEARARADSDTAFAQQITTLTAAIDDNAAAIQVESTTRATQYDALAEQITLVSAGVGEQFDFKQIWHFDDSVDGWTGNGSPTVSGGWLRPANHATNPYVDSPVALAITATQHNQVRLRIRKYGNPIWAGKLWWKRTTDSTWDVARSIALDAPTYDANGVGLASVSVPWSDTIHQVRLALSTSQDATNYFTIDWFAVGRPSPGASTAALLNEATARAAADTALTNQLNSLSSTVTGNYGTLNAAITTEATTRANADSALSSQINSVSATASGKSKVFVQSATPAATQPNDLWIHTGEGNKTYYWNGTTWAAVDDARIAQTAAAVVTETNARVDGDEALASQITALTSTVGTNDSTVRGLVASESSARATADAALADQVDALSATVSSNDTAVRGLVASESSARADGDQSLARTMDFISATAEAVRSATAALAVSETIARASEDEAFVSRVETIQATVNGNTAAVEVASTAINGLQAQHTIKVRAGGAIAGIGLAATDSGEGGVTSEVAIVSDKFYIAPPSGTSKGAKVFAHYTVPTTVNGQSVPAGTYIESAYIPYGAINRLHFDKATGNKIIAADATFGDVLADTIKVVNANIVGEIKSDNFATGSTGWRIHKNGVAEFSSAIVRGTVYATNGEFYGTLKGGAATSYTAGDGLWAGMNGATYNFRLGTTTNYLRWTGSALEIKGTVTITDAAGNILLSSGSGIPWSKISAKPTSLAEISSTEGNKLAGIAPGADVTSQNTAAAIAGQGAFATLNKINAENVTTYIENAAFGNAQIGGNLWSSNWTSAGGSGWLLDRNGNFYGNNIYARGDIEASSLKANTAMVNRANIVNAAVDTLQIAGNAVTIPLSGESTTAATLTLPWADFGGAPVQIIYQFSVSAGLSYGHRLYCVLERDGVVIKSDYLLHQGNADTRTLTGMNMVLDYPGGGWHYYQVRFYKSDPGYSGMWPSYIRILVLGVKR